MVAVQFGMTGDGVCLLNCAGINDIAGIEFPDVGYASTIEGGGDEEIARQKDRQGYE